MPEPRWRDVDMQGNCSHCGGKHYGSGLECPFREENMGQPCQVCEQRTNYCCSDCAIDGAGKVYVCTDDDCRALHERKHKAATDNLSPWPEQRPPHRSEGDRARFAEEMTAYLPKPDGAVHISEDDIKAMKAAFMKRFDEQLPRTETLFAVAHVGYRMALRDLATKK